LGQKERSRAELSIVDPVQGLLHIEISAERRNRIFVRRSVTREKRRIRLT
jgi:hypothetical protein